MVRLSVLALAAVALVAGNAADAEEKPSAQVIGVAIHKRLPTDLRDLRVKSGVRIETLVSVPGKHILNIDGKASRLERCVDDKGTDLTKNEDGFERPWVARFGQRRSKDTQNLYAELDFATVPASGASRILLKGLLVVRIGAEEKTIERKDLVVKKGERTTVGAYTLVVVAREFDPDASLAISLTYPPDNFRGITFHSADGKQIKARRVGEGRGEQEYFDDYALDIKADKVTVKITYFEKVEQVTVPLDLEIGLGL